MTIARAAFALCAVAMLADCGGGGATTNTLLPPANVGPAATAKVRIVGIGDSLTAGVQSGALVGTRVPTPATVPQLGAVAPAGPTQENGFWALLWEQANGVGADVVANAATSPLPLIAPPGIGNLLALTSSGFPLGLNPVPAGATCSATTQAAYGFDTAPALRLAPSITPYDVAVPGMTLHEALTMTGPLSTCDAVPPAFAGINALVGSESENIYPVLETFGKGVTQLSAALALKAQFATVFLGENDLLKPLFTGGAAPVTAPTSFASDITSAVQQLQAGGAKILLANLPDPLRAATLIPQPAYQATLAAFLARAILAQNPGTPPATARAIAAQTAQKYAQAEIAQTGVGAGGYFTINALFATLRAASVQANAPTLSAAGDFVTDALAAQTEQLLGTYNAAIAAAAASSGAALVDLHAIGANTAYGQPIAVAPGDLVTTTYGGGLFSLDGLHFSNTGYAVVANTFIVAMNQRFATAVPLVNVDAIYRSDPSRFAQ